MSAIPVAPAGLAEAPHLAALLAEVREAARQARRTPLPELPFSAYRLYEDTGDRYGYEHRYFERRSVLAALGVEALTDPAAPLDALQDVLWAICDEYTWAVPAHTRHATELGRGMDQCVDLFACETADALAEITVLLAGRLDPRVEQRMRREVEHRVLAPLADDPRPIPWESFANNWSAVCAGSAGLAALALVDDPERLERILERCLGAMKIFLDGFAADGGCAEGVGYWVYGFGYFTYFAEAVRAHFEGAVDPLAGKKIREIAAFPGRVGLGGGRYVTFSDQPTDRPLLPTGLLSRLHRRLGTPLPGGLAVPSFRDDHCYRWAHLWRTVTWTEPAALGRPDGTGAGAGGGARAGAGGSSYLPDLAWVVDRGAGLGFAAKGGHNAEPHNHNDLGQFTLHVGGEQLLVDLGAGEYRRDTFGEHRYEQLHASAAGHAVPVLDGQLQQAGREYAAWVLEHQDTGSGVRFVLDLTAAYPVDGLRSLHRSFDWDRSTGRLRLTDRVEADRELPLEEPFLSRREPELEAAPDGSAVRWRGAQGQVRLEYGDGYRAAVESIDTRDHGGRPDRVHRLRLRGTAPVGVSEHAFTFTAEAEVTR